jgi:hypothetical protein
MIITIASFGYKSIIKRYFPTIDIITPGFFKDGVDGLMDFDDKNSMIYYLMQKYKIKFPYEVLLVDDLYDNIINWRKEGGYAYEVCPSGFDDHPRGISKKDAENIINYVKLDRGIKMIVYDASFTLFNTHVTSKYVYPHIFTKISNLEKFEDKLLDDLIIKENILAEGIELLQKYKLL